MSYVNTVNKDWIVVRDGGSLKPIKAYKVHKTAKKFAKAHGNAVVMSTQFWVDKCNEKVTVYNCITNKPVEICRSELGGCCDPSTERYHSM